MSHQHPRLGSDILAGPTGRRSVPLLRFLLLAFIVLIPTPSCVAFGWADFLLPASAHDAAYASNWLATVKTVLPASAATNVNFDYHQATNALCAAGRRGNLKAQALWGITLLGGDSPESSPAGLELLRDAAEKGCVPAMVQLGFLYEEGRYVRKNYDHALHWFTLAANAVDPVGQTLLGGFYHSGLGTTPNFFMAAKYYRLAAEQNNYVAMKSLGYLLMNGLGIPKDEKEARFWLLRSATEGNNRRAMFNLGVLCGTNASLEAFHWFQQSADLGDDMAAFAVARYYHAGEAPGGANQERFQYWRSQAASLGCAEAQYEMGVACRTGDGVPPDSENSLAWYRKAAVKHHPAANYDLALHYLADKSNPASARRAHEYMRAAAAAGHCEAQLQYALGCFRGDAGAIDVDMGREWLAKAAANGWPRAQFFLFQFYYNGTPPALGCPPYTVDKVKAIEWLRRAALHGLLSAQATLAVMLIRGVDIEKDPGSAENLLRNAATHGYAQAQNDLGFAMNNGDIVAKDPIEAAAWLRLAAAHATDATLGARVQVNLSRALARLTPDQVSEVGRRVEGFQPLAELPLNPLVPGWEKNSNYQAEDPQQ